MRDSRRIDGMHKAGTVTAALEDYLEAIFNLCRFDKAARSRDIAELLNVHKSTVTAALKSLGQMNLINYSPYEAVTLTPEGRKLAEDVAIRHSALRDFFINVLKVDKDLAESAACGMEHSVPKEIVEKLAHFAVSMQDCPRLTKDKLARKSGTKACDSCLETRDSEIAPMATTAHDSLADVEPGRTVKVIGITVRGNLKKRLTEMGLTRGAEVTVERVAPLGDPLDVRVRGYHLSLRKEEAAKVLVKD